MVEGFPRSANSFFVGMLELISRRQGLNFKMAHHTHSVVNLRLAKFYGIPRVVLIRRPLGAILSYHIFSGISIERCLDEYVKFYTSVQSLKPYTVVTFDDVTSRFSGVLNKLNQDCGFSFSAPESFEVDVDQLMKSAKLRGRAIHGERSSMRTGYPDEEREEIKRLKVKRVEALLDDNPQANALYDDIVG